MIFLHLHKDIDVSKVAMNITFSMELPDESRDGSFFIERIPGMSRLKNWHGEGRNYR